MSKFIDKLNQVSQVSPQPMGFRMAPPTSHKPKMVLIASLAQASASGVDKYVAGADAGLLPISTISEDAKSLQKVIRTISDIPWGGWLKDGGRGEIAQIVKAGCDFVVFPSVNTSLALFQDDEVGKVLAVEESLSEGLLTAVDDLPVDAVLIASKQEGEYFLTWHHLMVFRHFADLLTKPLLVSVPSNVTANELRALWEAGVVGVVVEVGQHEGGLNELRQAIDKLTFSPQRKRTKPTALLPYTGRSTETVTEEEE